MNKLDANQIIKLAYDPVTGGLLTTPSTTTSFNVELSAADGDSVQSTALMRTAQATGLTSTNTGIVLAELSIEGISSLQIYTKTISTITGPQVLTVEVSPVVSADVWFTTTITVTPSTTAGTVVASSIGSIAALRARIKTTSAISSGSYDLYLVGR